MSKDSERLPTGVVTFLLTDIEGSTALWDAVPSTMPVVLDRHNQLVDAAVRAAGGVMLKEKGEGDSTFCVFGRATDAADAALRAQAALGAEPWPEEAPIRVRMSLHTGEAIEADRDYFGPTVNRAARLRSVATGGQIVLSATTAGLVADHLPDGFGLVELGEFALAGLSRPERVLLLGAVDDTAAEAAAARTSPRSIPAPLAMTDTLPLVGRTAELSTLRAALGAGRLVVLAGEPGVGKTRLAAHLAREEHDRGTLVLFGRCTDELGVAFQPFAEALDRYVSDAPAAELRAHTAAHGGVLIRLAPTLGRRLGGLLAPTADSDADAGRARLFDAVRDLLDRAGRDQPVLLVLDDVHWAARPTLQLLQYLLTSGANGTLAVVATYRDTELDRAHPLAAVLADLRRLGAVERVGVGGLDRDGVTAFVSAAASLATVTDDDTIDALAAAVHQRTEGNPFFVGQVLRHLLESGQVAQRDGRWELLLADELPEGVREVVTRRLSRLSDGTNRVLTVAAVAGAEFDLAVLERVPEAAGDGVDVLDALDAAVAARVIAEVPGRHDAYRFAHALVRETVLAELSTARRARLHRRVAEAIEIVHPTDVASLAHHHAEAARAGDTTRAVEYALRAASEALVRCSYDEVLVHAERGLQVLELDDDSSTEARLELLRARVEGLVGAAPAPICLAAIEEAAGIAEAAGARDTYVAIVGAPLAIGLTESMEALVPLMERAIDWLDGDDLRAATWLRLRIGLVATYEGIGWDQLDALRDALDVARGLDDVVRAFACTTLAMALHGSGSLGEQRAAADEAWTAAQGTGDRLAEAFGCLAKIPIAVSEGDVGGAFVTLDHIEELVPSSWVHYLVAAWRTLEALALGRLGDAEHWMNETIVRGEGGAIAALSYSTFALWLRAEQGRVDEVKPLLAMADGTVVRAETAIRAFTAWADARTGDLAPALDIARELAADDCAAVPRNWVRAAVLAALSEVAAIADDAELAAPLLVEVEKYESQIFTAAFLVAVGASERCRGQLLDVLGRRDEAVACFERALAMEDAAPAPPLAARSRYWFARCLRRRDAPGDTERAADLLHAAAQTAAQLGMVQLAAEAHALL